MRLYYELILSSPLERGESTDSVGLSARIMSLRHIYERTFDEDVASIERANSGCPECGGLVHTNSIETACEDCGLLLAARPNDHRTD